MNNIQQVKRLIRKSSVILICGHTNPDGDSIGSLLSLGLGLQTLGKRVYMLSEGSIPKRYQSLPGASRIVRRLSCRPDLAISVDCTSEELLGSALTYFRNAKAVLEIDHHEFLSPAQYQRPNP
ncbi:MAG: DHH family phosphoesterase [Candidatus Omnitrophota bacterium]